jgi:hypothetical protein
LTITENLFGSTSGCIARDGIDGFQRTGLIESRLPESGEKAFAELTRKVIDEGARRHRRTVSCRHCGIIDENHLKVDDDPTIGPSPAR